MTPPDCDVVVVGGGPAGSASACLLAERGLKVTLVDRSHFPRQKACAEYMSPGVGQLLLRLRLDRAFEGVQVHAVPGMDIISFGGHRFRLQYCLDGRQHTAFTISRLNLDHCLVKLAQKRGVQVVEGFVAREPIIENGLVCGIVGSSRSQSRSIRSRLIIVADGSRSTLARSLNVALPPFWPLRMGLVAHFSGEPRLDSGYGQMHVSTEGYCGVAPLPEGQTNVAMVFRPSARIRTGEKASDFFDDWIRRRPLLEATLGDCRRISSVRGLNPLGSRVRREWGPGFLLVGDAAGFFDPFTGEGIYRALAGAELATDAAISALTTGDMSARSLKSYRDSRRKTFRRKTHLTELVQLFVQCSPLMEYAIPRLAARPEPGQKLANALGDLIDAKQFLNASTMASALRF